MLRPRRHLAYRSRERDRARRIACLEEHGQSALDERTKRGRVAPVGALRSDGHREHLITGAMHPAHSLVGERFVRVARGEKLPGRECAVELIAHQLLVARPHDESLPRRQCRAQRVRALHVQVAVPLAVHIPQQVADEIVCQREHAVVHERRLAERDGCREIHARHRLAGEHVAAQCRQRCSGGRRQRRHRCRSRPGHAGAQRGRETRHRGNHRAIVRWALHARDKHETGACFHELHHEKRARTQR